MKRSRTVYFAVGAASIAGAAIAQPSIIRPLPQGNNAQPQIIRVAKNPSLAVGGSPRGVAVGDFNGDGTMDIVTANQNSNNVSVLLAFAGGYKKAAASPLAVGAAPRSVAVGDFNGDKKPDIAAGNSGANSVTILLGDGTGGFAPAPGSPVRVGARPLALTVADFDGNDRSDLAVVNNMDGSVSLLLGNGAGGFTAAPGGPLPVGKTPFFVAAGDLDGDNKPDLVIANNGSNSVSVLLNTGAGTFGNAVEFATGANPRWVTIGDLTGDIKPDLAVANSAGNTVSILEGNGKGGFGTKTDLNVGAGPRSVVAGDFNGDGTPDLAVTNGSDNSVTILPGVKKGGFAAPVQQPITVGSGPAGAISTDVTGDAKLDLVVVNSGSDDVSVLVGDGAGGFKAR